MEANREMNPCSSCGGEVYLYFVDDKKIYERKPKCFSLGIASPI